MLARTCVRQFHGQSAGLRAILRDLEGLLEREAARFTDEERRELEADRDLLAISTVSLEDDPDVARRCADNVIAALPPNDRRRRGAAMFWLGLAMQATGDGPEAICRLNLGLAEEPDDRNQFSCHILWSQALIHWNECSLSECERVTGYMYRIASERELESSLARARLTLGLLAYERNDLECASDHFSAVLAFRDRAHFASIRDALFGLSLVQQAQGKMDEALAKVELLVEMVLRRQALEHLPTVESFQARLALKRGDFKLALRWLDSAVDETDSTGLAMIEVVQITRIKCLLEDGSAARLDAASNLLDHVEERARTTHDRRRLVEIEGLRALALRARGETDGALSHLAGAIAIAEPNGMVRSFVDLGPSIVPLLVRLNEQTRPTTYVEGLIAACANEPWLPSTETTSVTSGLPKSLVAANASQGVWRRHVFELLTEREAEILTCLNSRLSNREIADRLFISPLTVKRHATNIYEKLGVAGRRQAIVKATQLGFLPHS